ncbi:hypothetical protein F0358_06320 [Empedobacter brevis]|uniref:Lipoprotein n=1 Tax=Empedobacter brevis NBRC 14943 = ATCC 43319 TaxID=1218108 RepID=A0A511NE56_9FLAO|nr:hypothetical protein [Empedobacter brevis]QES92355.1 hypothetical protein F0358_06320 [Empedobacter brevis]GEM50897.1 hypothetical protein EB1_06870 [Empedobacter brevis NBRC 14943 = ATCC 43319]
MVKIFFSIFFILFSCIPVIKEKENLIPKSEIGIFNSNIRTDGYYYYERTIELNDNEIANGILYYVFNKEGFFIFKSTIFNYDTIIPFERLHEQIQNDLKLDGINSKTLLNNGVYIAMDNDVMLRSFSSYHTNFTYGYKIIKGNAKLDSLGRLTIDNIVYNFKQAQISNFDSVLKRKKW